MAISTLTPFPYNMQPLTNTSPLSYRDGTTYLEELSQLQDWLNTVLVPGTNSALQTVYADFQAGIANAEATIASQEATHVAAYAAFTTAVNAANTAFQTAVNNTTAANLATMQTEYATFVATINATIGSISNRVGPENMHRLLLTTNTVQNVDVLWPTAHPIMFQVTQDGTGGHALTFGPGVTGTLVLDPTPNALTEFQLVPNGAGNWVIHPVYDTTTAATIAGLGDNFAQVHSANTKYGNGVIDATAHLQSVIDAANIADADVYVPDGVYKVTAPLEDVRRMHLAAGATITAGVAGMSAVIRTRNGTRLDGGYLTGKGVIDPNTNAAIGVHVRDFLHFTVEGIYITGGNVAAMKLGDAGSSGRSAEAVVTGVRIANSGNVVALSRGILVEHSGDHSFSQIVILNYEYGMTLPVGGNAVVHDVHSWADPAKGAMKVGFEDHSGLSHYNSCHADSPTQYGWLIYGYGSTLVQCGTYLNTGVPQILDNTVVGIRFESTYSQATIIGHFFTGGDGTHRFKSDIETVDGIIGGVTYIGCTNSNVVTLTTDRNRIVDIIMDANVGAQIGTNPAQKLGFYGAPPIVRPSLTYSRATETAADTQIRALLDSLGLATDLTVP